jgi:hypothetical protein
VGKGSRAAGSFNSLIFTIFLLLRWVAPARIDLSGNAFS